MTHYEVLRVAPNAPVAEVRQAYLDQARRHHPDRGGDPKAMRAVNEAWAALSDPGRRALYDLQIGGRTSDPIAAQPVFHHVRSEAEDLRADLADDNPIGGTIRLPRWIALLPVGTFALSILFGVFGVFFVSSPMIGLAFMAFLASCVLFLVSPFVALYASRRVNR